jgi:mannosyltransferase
LLNAGVYDRHQFRVQPVTRLKDRMPRFRPRHRSLMWSAIPLAVATAAVGIFRLGHQALWFDESISAHVAELPLPTMLRVFTIREAFHAFYDLLLHFWQLGGTSETSLRSLSVVLGVGTVLTLFALNVRLFDRRTAVTGCTLLIVNVFFIRYMQEARSYALALFLVVTASWCFVVAIEKPSTSRWIAYAITSAAATWAHVFAGFVIASHLMSLLVRKPRPPFRLVAGSYLFAASLVAPLVVMAMGGDPLERSFVQPPTAESVERLFLYLTGGAGVPGRGTHLLLLGYFAICCAAFRVMARMENRHRHTAGRWANALALLWLAVPVVATFLISFARPIFYPRYLIVVLPALVTIAGIGISSLPHRALRGLAIAAVIVLSGGPLFSYYRTPIREGGDWRAATMYVAEQEHSGDGIVFLSRYGRGSFEYYAQRFGSDPMLAPLYPSQPWGKISRVTGYTDSMTPAAAAEHLHTVTRVWTFLAWGAFESNAEDGGPIRRVLEDGYTLLERREFGPSLEVRLYAPIAAGSH